MSGRNGGGMPGDAERDPRLDRVYRDGGREEPPARLDAAILAAARREVGAGPRPLSRLRVWRVPVSIAAVVVLSVSVVTLVREEGGGQLEQPSRNLSSERADRAVPTPKAAAPADTPLGAAKDQVRPQPPAAAPAIPPAARDDAAAGTMAGATNAGDLARREADLAKRSAEVESGVRQPEPFHAAPPPAPAASAPVERRQSQSADRLAGAGMDTQGAAARGEAGSSAKLAESAEGARTAQRMKQRDAAPAEDVAGLAGAARAPADAAVEPKAVSKPADKAMMRSQADTGSTGPRTSADAGSAAALVKELGSQPPEKWLAKIETLRREGRKGEADDLLAEFKRRFPTHPVPVELR